MQRNIKCVNGVWIGSGDVAEDGKIFFGDQVMGWMKKCPEKIGQIDGKTGKKDNYAAMLDRAVRCAIWMKKLGIKSGDFIGIYTQNHLDTFVPVIAAVFNGIIFHPWGDINSDEDLVKYYLQLGEPRAMFVEPKDADLIQKAIDDLHMSTKIIIFDEKVLDKNWLSLQDILQEQTPEEVSEFECAKIEDPNQACAMICTSGTTGYPKGILLSYNHLSKGLMTMGPSEYYGNSIVLWPSVISWISALGSVFDCLRNNATAVIYTQPDAKTLCNLIEKYKINCLFIGTAHCYKFYHYKDIKQHDLSSVIYVGYGGGPIFENVDRKIKEFFPNADLLYSYGASEIGACLRKIPGSTKVCCSGRVQRHYQIKVVDSTNGRILGANERGEIYVKSPYMILKYHKNPESTRKAIDDDGWFRTGDLGYYDEDGDFFIIDRLNDTITFKLYNILLPSRIEAEIQKHPDVLHVAVVAKPDVVDVEVPMAFVELREGAKVTEADIIELVEKNLPDTMRLRGGVRFMDKLPTTMSGKIKKTPLRAIANDEAQRQFK